MYYWAKVRYDSRWTSIPFKGKGGRSSTAEAINIGNGGERSPIQSIILRVIEKIGRPRSYQSRDLSITSMITNTIGHHKVLLPINHNHYNFQKKTNTFRTNLSARDNVLSKKILQTGRRIQTDSSTWESFHPNNYFSCEAIFSHVVAKFKLLTSLPLSLPWAALSEWSTGFPKSDWYFFSTINNSFQEIINYVLSSTYSIWEWNLSKPMTTLWPARKKTKPTRVRASQQVEHARRLLEYCLETSPTRSHNRLLARNAQSVSRVTLPMRACS